MTIVLRSASPHWQRQFDELLAGSTYLQEKYNRERRLVDKAEYIDTYCRILHGQPHGTVVDVGCGPGEFLELCRARGWTIFGIEAPVPAACGMGDKYHELSRLMCARQHVPVDWSGIHSVCDDLATGNCPRLAERVALWNFQGSWGLCWARHLIGTRPMNQPWKAPSLSWDIGGELIKRWTAALAIMRDTLLPDGAIVVVDNQYGDRESMDRYCRGMIRAGGLAGLFLKRNDAPNVHVWGIA